MASKFGTGSVGGTWKFEMRSQAMHSVIFKIGDAMGSFLRSESSRSSRVPVLVICGLGSGVTRPGDARGGDQK